MHGQLRGRCSCCSSFALCGLAEFPGSLPRVRSPAPISNRLRLDQWLPTAPDGTSQEVCPLRPVAALSRWRPRMPRRGPQSGSLLGFSAVVAPVVSDGANLQAVAAEWVWQSWQWLKTLRHWWLQSLGPLLLSTALLLALKTGLLPRVHSLMVKWMTYILREPPKKTRSYRQSYLYSAERPLVYFSLLSFVCHAVTTCAGPFLSQDVAKTVIRYSAMTRDLSGNIGLGLFFYGVVNQKIARSSRGLAKKSDILGAETSRQESQVLAVGQTARVLVVLCTTLTCLPVFHVDIGTLLSFCGAGGLAISLVSKGVVVNLIGSLTLYLTQPFTLGDWIQTVDGELDGWVQSMGPYHTVLMRWDRRPVYIPNSRFVNTQIINASRMTNRRILMDVPVRIADLHKVDAILYDITELINTHKALSAEMHRIVRLRKIECHAAMIWVSCYTIGINLKEYVDVREDILLNIKNIMFKHGTTFASSLERTAVGGWGGTDDAAGLQPPVPASMPLQPQGLDSQKPALATELQRLKQLQETLWERERELRASEQSLAAQRASLLEDQARLQDHRLIAETEDANVQRSLEELAGVEAELRFQEESIDSSMDDLQVREDALDQLMRELSAKDSEREGQGILAPRDAAKQRAREESVEQADRVIEIHQEMLSQEKRALEQEREVLQEQKAKVEGREGGAAEEEHETASSESPAEEEELKEAARTQKIAESLGGE